MWKQWYTYTRQSSITIFFKDDILVYCIVLICCHPTYSRSFTGGSDHLGVTIIFQPHLNPNFPINTSLAYSTGPRGTFSKLQRGVWSASNSTEREVYLECLSCSPDPLGIPSAGLVFLPQPACPTVRFRYYLVPQGRMFEPVADRKIRPVFRKTAPDIFREVLGILSLSQSF